MVMEERRWRRSVIGRRSSNALLPLRVKHLSNTISCWYCDLKISALNQSVFRFGRRHARFLRFWFSMGIGFSLATLIAVTGVLVWELAGALHLHNAKTVFTNLFRAFLFGFSPQSCMNLVMLFLLQGTSSMESSEGVQMEYIAVFIAVIFPGALVAFNYEMLQALPRFAAFRIYSAGIWHNAVCCAVCGLALCLLPFVLFPLYIHGESPMVLNVSPASPLSGYLSPGDLIVSLDGISIHNVQEWMGVTSMVHEQTVYRTNHSKDLNGVMTINGQKGYCVPSFMIQGGQKIQFVDNQAVCPEDLTPFLTLSCADSSIFSSTKEGDQNRQGKCLAARDIVKLNKCRDGWITAVINRSSCICSQDEYCLAPVYFPGLSWVEIRYSSPYSSECLQLRRNTAFPGFEAANFGEIKCGGTFVFVGDMISMAHSVQLTAYQPRWKFAFVAYFPNVLEKILMSTYHVSLTLALLNSLPVYFLDGESILEVTVGYFTLLNPWRVKVLQACLFGGTLASVLVFYKMFLFNIL
ncbi:membrane-bound transcription factor site-2 protease homolog isoform X2 [Malania oleifera]|uniref:membrane-bound transcription factor site-2 protease homolog isoform X2 n=1 Tax=Malania oleifera TaxID=397392 RepID=UPI0025AE78D7|nr:membrane-bound transcription factor site-2 protease homolog isoform X2 [Malania oleifera]